MSQKLEGISEQGPYILQYVEGVPQCNVSYFIIINFCVPFSSFFWCRNGG